MGELVRPRIDVRAGMWAAATLVVLLALQETDGLIAQLLDVEQGRTYGPTGLTGPGTVRALLVPPWAAAGDVVTGWEFLADADVLDGRLEWWLLAYALLDGCLIALYGGLLWRLLSASVPSPVPAAGRIAAVVGVAADACESMLIATHSIGGLATARGWVLLLVSVAKWLGLVVAVAVLVRARWSWIRLVGPARLRAVLRGLYTHRSSLLIVVPVAVMGLARGHDILEQVPDIQRRWIDGDELAGLGAALLTVVLVALTLLIGRLRTDDLARRRGAPGNPHPSLALWYAGAIVIVGIGVGTRLLGGTVRPGALVLFAAVPLAIGVGSTVVRWRGWQGAPPPATSPLDATVRTAWLVGDVLPAALVVVVGASAVRSLTGTVLLDWPSWTALAATVGGAALAVGVWPVYGWALERLGPPAEQPIPVEQEQAASATLGERSLSWLRPGECAPGGRWIAPTVLAAAVALYLAVGLWPEHFAELGVLAVFQLSLGALAVAVAAAVSLNRRAGVPDLLWRSRLKVVPVTTLALVTAMIGASLPGATVHPIRTMRGAPADRLAFSQAFANWLAATEGCDVTVEGVQMRPMLLFAAEGGGIRAAYWTSAVIDAIAGADGPANCGQAFVSTGASGGSVGLTVASRASAGGATERVRAIADQSALSAAVVGLVARDQLFAAIGIGLPVAGDRDAGWVDRAGLIERAWIEAIPEFGDPFFVPAGAASPVGSLVLNSTASNGCRALLSQLALRESRQSGSCAGDDAPVAASLDVYRCTGQVTAATAALLSARFPYVTPAGETPCGGQQLKFVDGGYGENSGIVTQVDLAHEWLPVVRAHNRSAGSGPVVVPILVYLDNGTGSDLRIKPGAPPIEVLVPPLTKGAATTRLTSPESNLQRAADVFAPDQLGVEGDVAAVVAAWRPHATVVAYAASAPAVAVPLGWVLSPRAMADMDRAVLEPAPALTGHAALADVLRIVGAAGAPDPSG